MIDSLISDIKGQIQFGNMITRLILLNIVVFVLITLIGAFTYGGQTSPSFQKLIQFLAISGDPIMLLKKPWTLFTHMFLHQGFWHLFWNMLILYWFGRIVGDLLGDQRILPLYLAGGLSGAVFFIIFANLINSYAGYALGASAAVMCIVMASGFIAPYFKLNLLLIGEVKLMYVVAALFFLDVAMIGQNSNAGGHFAHIGGALFGGFYVYAMQKYGTDFLARLSSFFEKPRFERPPKQPAKVVNIHGAEKKGGSKRNVSQEEIDKILDKIKNFGINSLSEEEKDVLFKASKE